MVPSISSYESGGILDSKATVSLMGAREHGAQGVPCDAHDHLVDGVSQMAVWGQLESGDGGAVRPPARARVRAVG